MGTISNKFIVTALQDGQTVTGSLSISRSLWQSINKNNGQVIPNWIDNTVSPSSPTRPSLTPVLMSGGTQETPTSIAWKYNGVAMTFNGTKEIAGQTYGNICDSPNAAAGKFYNSGTALYIIDNIASITNDDSDTITAYGTVTVGDTTLSWECMETIRITESGTSSTTGEIVMLDGRAYLRSDTDSIRMQALLHDNTGDVPFADYQCKWYLNNSSTVWQTTTSADSHTVVLSGDDQSGVLDYTVVKAEFYKKKTDGTSGYEDNVCATALIGVDDLSDIEVMQFAYIIDSASAAVPLRFVLNNTSASTIKTGQAVAYGIWIGKKDNPTSEIDGWQYAISFYNAAQGAATGLSQDKGPKTGTFYVEVDGSTTATITNGVRSKITYQEAVTNGGTITAIVSATKQSSSSSD